MNSPRTFPVLFQGSHEHRRKLVQLDCPREVPWDFIAEHLDECLRYHDQTPDQLAQRGGLGPEEILVVIGPRMPTKERIVMWYMPAHESVPKLKEALASWIAARIALEQL